MQFSQFFRGLKPTDFGGSKTLGLFFMENFTKLPILIQLIVPVGLVPLDGTSEHFVGIGIGIR